MKVVQVDGPDVMTPREVCAVFKVDPNTLANWARAGKIPCFRTLGGKRRYYREDVERLLNQAAAPRHAGVL